MPSTTLKPTLTRKVDAKSRVVLPEQFTGKTVTIEATNDSEVVIRISKALRVRPSLKDLLSKVTPENLPEVVDFGPPVGNEVI